MGTLSQRLEPHEPADRRAPWASRSAAVTSLVSMARWFHLKRWHLMALWVPFDVIVKSSVNVVEYKLQLGSLCLGMARQHDLINYCFDLVNSATNN